MGGTSLALFKLPNTVSVHPLQALVQGSPLAGAVQLHQLLTGHVQQLVQVHVTVGEIEALLLLHFQHLARFSENSASPTPVQLSFKTLLV